MIADRETLRRYEDEQIRCEPCDFDRASEVFEELYQLACDLGALPVADPLEEIEVDERVIKGIDAIKQAPPEPAGPGPE